MTEPEILNVEPREAVEFFQSKGYHISFGWQDTTALEHAGSFTVAKVAELDILHQIMGAAGESFHPLQELMDRAAFEEFSRRYSGTRACAAEIAGG